MLDVFFDRIGVDQDIIYIHYYSSVEHVTEDIIDKQLEHRGTVFQAEWHNQIFLVPRGG